MIIDSTVWGPHGWKFIHMVALGYPLHPTDEQKKNYKKFFLSIANVLPCIICSNHYSENLIKYPLTDEVLKNKTNLLHWTIDMHNEVNKMNNSKVYSYEEALKSIRNNYNDKQNKEHNKNEEQSEKENKEKNEEENKEIPENDISSNLSKNDNKYLNYIFTLFCLIVIFFLFIFFLSIK